jgi:glycosyltransferase involved in cell wall biosynthesis
MPGRFYAKRGKHTNRPGLRVLVDCVAARVGGGGSYAVNQLVALARIPGINLTVYAAGSVGAKLREHRAPMEVIVLPERPLPARVAWEQTFLSRAALSYDVVYMMGNFALVRSSRPQVLLAQNGYHWGTAGVQARRAVPSLRHRARLAVEAAAARRSVERANCVVSVSQTLARAIEEDLGRLPHLRVITSAPAELGSAEGPRVVAEPYALAVAHDDPHKDWDGLMSVFERESGLPALVLVGRFRNPKRRAQLERRVAAHSSRIHLLGIVMDRSRLARLYRDAECYIAHSFLESFPLTPHEAMSQGLPIVASDIPAHREVCGDSAVYYPPHRLDLLPRAVTAVTGASAPSTTHPRSADRSWTDNATELADTLQAVAGRGNAT